MTTRKKIFLKKSKIAFDPKHRKTITYNISQYKKEVEKGKSRYLFFEEVKQQASGIKQNAIENLASNLEEFEKNIVSRGAKVLWTRDASEAKNHIKKIITEEKARLVVKSKSMISEEIDLNNILDELGAEPVETDLGEFIVQVAGEKPYHILTPAMHKSKEDVAELYNVKFGTRPDSSPKELTLFTRKKLREKFVNADIGITGANFLVADIGAVALTENEGNAMMSISFPKIHIVIAGIEKIIPSVNDLPLFFPLLAAIATGQQTTVYNSLIAGPVRNGESSGPEKMIVILLDNGRTEIYREETHRKALKCVHCGACLNVCPVYKNIGGYTYNTEYTGPIGSVITPFMKGFKDYGHLSFACSVCGACSEICPVKVPLHDMLLLNRKKFVEGGYENKFWNSGMHFFKGIALKRSNLDLLNGKLKNVGLKTIGRVLGNNKKNPQFAKQSFNQLWKDKNN